MLANELVQGLDRYEAHLAEISHTFDEAAAQQGIPVRMDHGKAVAAVRGGIGLAKVSSFWSRQDHTGVIHKTQLRTAVECFAHLLADQHRCGHVLGAMQSGKTTTSLALQWAGPVLYALRGIKAYPFYLISSQTSHEDQTRIELDRFLAYYGDLEINRLDAADPPPVALDAVFDLSPSLSNYREHVLRHGARDVFNVPQLADNVHRRVGGGQGVGKVAELCKRVSGQGFRSLMMIDEPQFGASDRLVPGEDGLERRTCVLAQIFHRIESELGVGHDDHWFVGLSATPFELNDLNRIWEVKQSLTPEYSGFNFFNGAEISPGVEVTPPTTIGLTAYAERAKIPFMANVSMAAYVGSGRSFPSHARRIGYEGTHADYRVEVEDAIRAVIRSVVAEPTRSTSPIGMCIRASNSNERTRSLISRLDLDPNEIEILEYFGLEATNLSVKRMIARRRSPNLPYVVFVTNRARMADAFPVEVSFFLDFAKRATDLNALLQGLLGRACGYGKRSMVVLSDENSEIVDAYVATTGGYVHKTSRHSIAVGGYRRGAPTSMLKIGRELADPIVEAFFQRIDSEVVQPHAPPGSTSLSPKRVSADSAEGFRTAPLLTIAGDLGLFERLEDPSVRTALFPSIPTGFQVARADDEVRHPKDGTMLRYQLSTDGGCRFTFRWSSRGAAAQGGAQGRAQGSKDVGQHMEPTVYVEKFDPSTGEIIGDRALERDKRRPGSWRAFMVTFPLLKPVRELRSAEVAYPIERSAYDPWVEPEERVARDGAERRVGRR